MSRESQSALLSIRVCLALAVAAGLLGLVLMRAMPVGTDHEYLTRYAAWARELQVMYDACGKHEPRDAACVARHPVSARP
jgi:hypothetical protein